MGIGGTLRLPAATNGARRRIGCQQRSARNSLPQLTAYGMLLQSIFATCDWDTSNARPPVGLCVRGL
eukprot:scaffold77322_cov58-Phaeocystis_antarctica.AAC.5